MGAALLRPESDGDAAVAAGAPLLRGGRTAAPHCRELAAAAREAGAAAREAGRPPLLTSCPALPRRLVSCTAAAVAMAVSY